MAFAVLIALLGQTLLVLPAEAAIYKCLESDGGISYSSTACTDTNQTARVLADNGINEIGSDGQYHSTQKANSPQLSNQQRSEASKEEQKRRTQRLSGELH